MILTLKGRNEGKKAGRKGRSPAIKINSYLSAHRVYGVPSPQLCILGWSPRLQSCSTKCSPRQFPEEPVRKLLEGPGVQAREQDWGKEIVLGI